MKPRTIQLGARKNPDSPRVHGLRLEADSSSTLDSQTHEFQAGRSLPPVPSASAELNSRGEEEGTNGTTVGRERQQGQLLTVHEVADLLHVPVSWVYGRMRKRSQERLPGYRLGKYWRFREAEVLAWVESQRGDWHAA